MTRAQKSLAAVAIALSTVGAAAVAVMTDHHIPSTPDSAVVAQDHHMPVAPQHITTSLASLDNHIP
ncbi:hypothetical protein [Streptomyces chattanoogensis]|uniref:Lipoprotein n=1 Tax=Streptomyces chattanoogensis TaxID=66876 RepID=A0A0N0GYY1_9ACTN|nr:hypothetical protein [Streptomyces chattanoogensis]KPC62272.1 hypothetical protein ADL29_21195 [Streptomyces chattanoogensis]